MAINTSWKIEIGLLNPDPVDFTSRTLSASIFQQVNVNEIGRGIATVTLLNKDGALTPGGGGTYSSTDWFAQAVFITALTNTGGANNTDTVFHGLVNGFDLYDDGVYSTVTLTAVDALTVAGKSPGVSGSSYSSSTYASALTTFMTAGGTVKWPFLGWPLRALNISNLSGETLNVKSDGAYSFTSFADLWSQALIPSANDVLWHTTIATSGGVATYNVVHIPMTNTPSSANRQTYEFDPPASLSGSKLPFDDDGFQQAFNNETLITSATIQGAYTGATATTVNASTVDTYGSRTVNYTGTWIVDATGVSDMATKFTNRYSTSRFTPVSLVTSASRVKALAADAAHNKWRALLNIGTGLWQQTKITWAGSGAASQTGYSIITARKINITPSDTTITLTLLNWTDNHGFILDEDALDTGRLG